MKPPSKGILDEDGNVVPCDDLYEWGAWYEHNHRQCQIGDDELSGYRVSTVFLAVSYGEKPFWFETMIFNQEDKPELRYGKRYATRAEAIAGHAEAIKCLHEFLRSQ